jgi:hypothetical protein
MEGMRQQEFPVYQHRFNRSEITDTEYAHMKEAERNQFITLHPAGPFLFVDFLAIKDADKLPSELVHITSAKNAEKISHEGLHSDDGKVYMQSPELRVEPEHISLHRPDQALACITVNTRQLLNKGKKIILDPESVHGCEWEFMHSFVVYGSIDPLALKIRLIPK